MENHRLLDGFLYPELEPSLLLFSIYIHVQSQVRDK